jgi:hypothetical protein
MEASFVLASVVVAAVMVAVVVAILTFAVAVVMDVLGGSLRVVLECLVVFVVLALLVRFPARLSIVVFLICFDGEDAWWVCPHGSSAMSRFII